MSNTRYKHILCKYCRFTAIFLQFLTRSKFTVSDPVIFVRWSKLTVSAMVNFALHIKKEVFILHFILQQEKKSPVNI